jgi:hypothetical protein
MLTNLRFPGSSCIFYLVRFFEENMRSKVDNNNTLMESLKLRRYMEEMYRQERGADVLTAQEHAEMEAQRATFRSSQLTKMEQSRNEKVKKLQHDDAVHATLLKHKVRKCNPAQAQGARVHTQAWQPISESG